MFAVFKSGGHQYRAKSGDKISVDFIKGNVGDEIKIDQVLMVGEGDKANYGSPLVKGATITAKIAEQGRGPKILVFKYKRRKNYKKNARAQTRFYNTRN